MVHFVGAGSGAADLITLRGKKFLEEADVVIYAGSLVNPELLDYTKKDCSIYNSAKMTLEEVLEVMKVSEEKGLITVRLHTGDPSIYGAIREQMDVLDAWGIFYDYCPGVSAFCGAASALNLEYTLPEVSQSVIITRMAGRTPVPEKESIESFAAHQATMVLFLVRACWRSLRNVWWRAVIPLIPRLRSYIKRPGRMRRNLSVPLGRWLRQRKRMTLQRQR